MNTTTPTPQGVLTEDMLNLIVQQAHARMMVAIFILLGMVAIMLASTCFAFNWRKVGFIFFCVYGGLMSFIGVGFCYIFGPAVIVAALGGLMREFLTPKKA